MFLTHTVFFFQEKFYHHLFHCVYQKFKHKKNLKHCETNEKICDENILSPEIFSQLAKINERPQKMHSS